MKKLLLLTSFLLISIDVYAANATVGPTNITRIENWVGGKDLYLNTSSGGMPNPAGCTYTDKFHMPSSASDISKSIILSSYVSGKKVKLTIWDGGCSNSRPQVVAVVFQE